MTEVKVAMNLILGISDPHLAPAYADLAEQLGIAMLPASEIPNSCTHLLDASGEGLALLRVNAGTQVPGATRVDFSDPALLYRLRTSGKSQGLGKALGLARYSDLKVLDATAGLGRDALLIAHLGCEVVMLERSNLVYALLADGLARARVSEEQYIAPAVSRMSLQQAEAREYFVGVSKKERPQPDVIYLDPMFPPRSKSAKVKKDIALLHDLLGVEEDFPSLLEAAITAARLRVVVKRPGNKSDATVRAPSFTVPGKTAHFEVYVSSSFSSISS